MNHLDTATGSNLIEAPNLKYGIRLACTARYTDRADTPRTIARPLTSHGPLLLLRIMGMSCKLAMLSSRSVLGFL